MNGHEDEHEDPDWEALAAEGAEAELIGALTALATAIQTRIANSPPLDVSRQRPGTRLVVNSGCQEEDNPQRESPVEFTVLDPASLKVLVRDARHFPEPTEGTLLGSGEKDGTVTSPGQLKWFSWLLYQVGGKEYRPHIAVITRVEIYEPGRAEPLFVLWQD
jgi:hypothetical protein